MNFYYYCIGFVFGYLCETLIRKLDYKLIYYINKILRKIFKRW